MLWSIYWLFFISRDKFCVFFEFIWPYFPIFPIYLYFLLYPPKTMMFIKLLIYDWWKSEKTCTRNSWYVYDTLMVDRGICIFTNCTLFFHYLKCYIYYNTAWYFTKIRFFANWHLIIPLWQKLPVIPVKQII